MTKVDKLVIYFGVLVFGLLLAGCPANDPAREANQVDKNIGHMNEISEELMQDYSIKLYTENPIEAQEIKVESTISLADLETVVRPKVKKYIDFGQKVLVSNKKKHVRVVHADNVMIAVRRAQRFLRIIDERIRDLKGASLEPGTY